MAGQRISRRDSRGRRRYPAKPRTKAQRLPSMQTVVLRSVPTILRSPQILQLQRSAGNRAVTRLVDAALIQRKTPDPRRDGAAGLASADFLAKAQVAYFELRLREKGDPSTRKRDQEMLKIYREFPSTRVAPIRNPRARVLRSRSFLMVSPLATLRRGHKVTVLGMKGSWCRVRTPSGTEGWMHRNHIFPRGAGVRLRSGDTAGGTTQGETEFGGRG